MRCLLYRPRLAIILISKRIIILISKHIPSSIRAHTSDYTTIQTSYNWTSAISRHLLTNQTCACVYSPTMFTILETSINEQQRTILEALLIKKYKSELCIQKQFYTALLFNNVLEPSEEKTTPRNKILLHYSNFFQYIFLQPPWIFLLLQSHAYFLPYKIDCRWQFSEEKWPKERVPFLRILIRSYDFKTFLTPCSRFLKQYIIYV